MVAAVGLTGFAAAGCGGSSDSLSASEFVDKVNEQGVAMRLGRQLQTSGAAEQVFAIALPPLPGEPAPPPGREGGRGGTGSLYVYGDTGGADEQLKACRASAGLLCFQASNVVVVLDEESGGIAAQRLGVAIRRLE